MYPEAMQRSDLTREYILHNEINPYAQVSTFRHISKYFSEMADGAVRALFQDQWLINS